MCSDFEPIESANVSQEEDTEYLLQLRLKRLSDIDMVEHLFTSPKTRKLRRHGTNRSKKSDTSWTELELKEKAMYRSICGPSGQSRSIDEVEDSYFQNNLGIAIDELPYDDVETNIKKIVSKVLDVNPRYFNIDQVVEMELEISLYL